jgi:dynein heavy chain
MDLVFYTDAIEHLVRIHRILRIEGGNALLVGVGGSGKQSLSRMATFLAKYEMWQIKITSRFDEKGFKEQLVELFRKFKVLEEVNPSKF